MSKTRGVSIRMTVDTLRKLKAESKRVGVSGSEIVRRALELYLSASGWTKHGASVPGSIYYSEYTTWANMIQRCTNPKCDGWSNYGGRGIKVCERWRHSFEAFLEDLGSRPSSLHSLDRENNDGDYEPGNCRWATRSQQSANRRTVRPISFRGATKSAAAWGRELEIDPGVIRRRLRSGWSIEEALTEPVYKNRWERVRAKARV